MIKRFNLFLDDLSDFLSRRKGLLPFVGVFLIFINFLLRLFGLDLGWVTASDVLLHLGTIVAILGFMVAWAL